MMIKEEIMREAGTKLRSIFDFIISSLTPGKKFSDINVDVGTMLGHLGARSGLKMLGFPGNFSICIDEEVIQGLPDDRVIKSGDLVSIDMTLYYKGFFVDKAVSLVIEPQHYVKRYLVNAVQSCLKTALQNIRPGITTGSIGALIETQASLLKVKVSKEFYGHAIGESHHMKPLIPNFNDGSSSVIKRGDFLAIEPIVFYDHYSLKHSGFDVSSSQLSAHAEETILVTDNGVEVIT